MAKHTTPEQLMAIRNPPVDIREECFAITYSEKLRVIMGVDSSTAEALADLARCVTQLNERVAKLEAALKRKI